MVKTSRALLLAAAALALGWAPTASSQQSERCLATCDDALAGCLGRARNAADREICHDDYGRGSSCRQRCTGSARDDDDRRSTRRGAEDPDRRGDDRDRRGDDRPARRETVSAEVVPVGKWPEGIAFDGRSMWIAESGDRQIARLGLDDTRISDHVRVGRLPVQMVSGESRVFALVQTDAMVWVQPQRGRSGQFASVNGCPQAMSGDFDHLWVLTWDCNSSERGELFHIDPQSGRVTRSGELGPASTDVASGEGKAWVVHNPGRESIIWSFERQRWLGDLTVPGVQLGKLAYDQGKLFAAGSARGEREGVVLLIDPRTNTEVHRRTLDEPISVIVPTAESLLALGKSGTMWMLSLRDLSVLREVGIRFGRFEPRSAATAGGKLYITTHRGRGENGSVLVVDDWDARSSR